MVGKESGQVRRLRRSSSAAVGVSHRKRAGFDFAGAFVACDQRAGVGETRDFVELELAGHGAFAEQTLALAEQDRENEEMELVDQMCFSNVWINTLEPWMSRLGPSFVFSFATSFADDSWRATGVVPGERRFRSGRDIFGGSC